MEENEDFDLRIESDGFGDEIVQVSTQKIFTSIGDLEIDSLHNKKIRGRLILQPDFQRQYVWDSIKASKLIESAVLQIPLPIVYLSEEKDGKEYVIDGPTSPRF